MIVLGASKRRLQWRVRAVQSTSVSCTIRIELPLNLQPRQQGKLGLVRASLSHVMRFVNTDLVHALAFIRNAMVTGLCVNLLDCIYFVHLVS